MGFFKACKGCDSKIPGCHSYCEKYKAEREEYDRLKAVERKKHDTMQGLKDQRAAAVGKAMRHNRRWK